MSGPNSNPEVGQQNYRTPPAFLEACHRRFRIPELSWDLACTEQDCVGVSGGYFWPEVDSLKEDWNELYEAAPDAALWLNPPFALSKLFAKKCAEARSPILALVPVAIGTRWWRQHVHRKAVVAGVGRLVFNNPDGSPVCGKKGKPQSINRDCALLAYRVLPPGTDWYLLEDWKTW